MTFRASMGAVTAAGTSRRPQRNTLAERMSYFWAGTLKGFALKNRLESSAYTAGDFAALAATGANVVRVPLLMNKNVGGTFYDYPEADLVYVESVLAYGVTHRFRVIVVLVPLPDGQASEWWDNASLRASIVSRWVEIANRLKGSAALQAYDIINEPVAVEYTLARKNEWRTFAQAIATPLRAEDPSTPIMVEPAWWGLPSSFWQTEAIAVTGLVYSFHMYERREVTHQGINGYPTGVNYPNVTDTKSAMFEAMVDARTFSTTYNVPMFVGEFSCIRWAPGSSSQQYLTDCTDLMRDQRWGWTYHVWRGYDGWDAEIPTAIPQDTGVAGDRTTSSASYILLDAAMADNLPAV